MPPEDRATARWLLDLLWLLFLCGLALLPPINEIHKQLILLGIGLFQLIEARFIRLAPERGRIYAVLIKIGLATLLLGHTAPEGTDTAVQVSINSSYYPIYYLPV